MVQLTGTTMWAPLLFGGALGGVFADRFDRLRTIQWQLALDGNVLDTEMNQQKKVDV